MEGFDLSTPAKDVLRSQNLKPPPRAPSITRSRAIGFAALMLVGLLGAEAAEFRHAAATPDRETQAAQAGALPSFSALVERVAPAVVSIRVKANPLAIAAHDEEGEDQRA